MPTEGTIYRDQERVEAVIKILKDELTSREQEFTRAAVEEGEGSGVSLVMEVDASFILLTIPLATEMLRVKGLQNTIEGEGEAAGKTIRDELTQVQIEFDRQAKEALTRIAQSLTSVMETEEEVLAFGEKLEAAGAKVTVEVVDDTEEEQE